MAMNGFPYWRHRCPLCRKTALRGVGAGSVGCWWCLAIFPERWLVDVLRLIDRMHGMGR